MQSLQFKLMTCYMLFCMHAGQIDLYAIVLTRALPRKWRLIELDRSQSPALEKACSAARGFSPCKVAPSLLPIPTYHILGWTQTKVHVYPKAAAAPSQHHHWNGPDVLCKHLQVSQLQHHLDLWLGSHPSGSLLGPTDSEELTKHYVSDQLCNSIFNVVVCTTSLV